MVRRSRAGLRLQRLLLVRLQIQLQLQFQIPLNRTPVRRRALDNGSPPLAAIPAHTTGTVARSDAGVSDDPYRAGGSCRTNAWRGCCARRDCATASCAWLRSAFVDAIRALSAGTCAWGSGAIV